MQEQKDQPESNKTLDNILDDVATDAPLPSPVADMPPQVTAQPVADTRPAYEPPKEKGKRGRKPLTPEEKAARKAAKAQANFARPNLDLPHNPHIPPSPAPGSEGIEPAANVAVSLVQASGMVLGGADAIMLPAEQMLAKDGFVSYFKAKGVHNVPAWVVLAGALAPYYMRVLSTAPAKSRVSTLFEKAYFGFKRITGKVKKNARFDRGHDHERENNPSQETSPKSPE